MDDVFLLEERDMVFRALEQSKKYSTSSLYKLMTSGGVRDSQMMTMWKCNIPLKIKNFIWIAAHNRIRTVFQLKKKQWFGPEECATCDKLETTDHTLFQCPIAVFLWSFLRNTLG